uniref:Uncharacterized protein n=1 Tax=Arundo donax TaxID=35708 RepID=A0A0A9A8V0_ARUDO
MFLDGIDMLQKERGQIKDQLLEHSDQPMSHINISLPLQNFAFVFMYRFR